MELDVWKHVYCVWNRVRVMDRIWSDRNPNAPNIYLTHCVPNFDPWFSAFCTYVHTQREGRDRQTKLSSVWLCIPSSLSSHWLIFVQMLSEYLHWTSTGLEISLLKTEIICAMNKHNTKVYLTEIYCTHLVSSGLLSSFQCPPLWKWCL